MATVTLRRSDIFPVGTTVGLYPAGSQQQGGPPTAQEVANAVVDGAGLLTVTSGSVASYTAYSAYALVNGEHRYARVRSTLDFHDYGRATGTGDTTVDSNALANVTASSGAFAVGQRISGPGIPGGTFLLSGSGASWTMSGKASATATGVALQAEGAGVPPTILGGTPRPGSPSAWAARVRQRRNLAGTS